VILPNLPRAREEREEREAILPSLPRVREAKEEREAIPGLPRARGERDPVMEMELELEPELMEELSSSSIVFVKGWFLTLVSSGMESVTVEFTILLNAFLIMATVKNSTLLSLDALLLSPLKLEMDIATTMRTATTPIHVDLMAKTVTSSTHLLPPTISVISQDMMLTCSSMEGAMDLQWIPRIVEMRTTSANSSTKTTRESVLLMSHGRLEMEFASQRMTPPNVKRTEVIASR
jgi:hypothetical protein